MKKNKKLDVVFILDKSGSMGGQEENTISSFKTGKTYTICKHCHNLFLPTRKGQENCFDKKCKQERDCLYKKN